MHKFNIEGKEYRIEFRHVTTEGKRRQLYSKRSPIRGITTCVVMWDDLVAIDNAICSKEDTYNKRDGRFEAFNKIMRHSRALRDVSNQLLAELLLIDPEPVHKAPADKPKITEEERQRRVANGAEKRAKRARA